MATRTRDHTTDTEASSDDVLANLDEEHKQQVQMQQIREATVERGLLKIPVKRVTTAENSEQYAVEPDHPVLDAKELRQFYEKPLHGWTDEYDIVQLLDWYCNGSDNPYDLQLHHVYCQYSEAEDEWTIVRPPTHTRDDWGRVIATWENAKRMVSHRRPTRSNAAMLVFMLTGLLLGTVVEMNLAAAQSTAGAVSFLLPTLGFLALTILGTMVLEP